MGNNKEIRQRMETYRTILLVLNWIGSIAVTIVGFALAGQIRGFSAIIIVIAIIFGIIGHFLINVALAIPFILLNNGDYLAAIVPDEKIIKINDEQKEVKSDLSNENNSHAIKKLSIYKNPDLSSGILFTFTEGEKLSIIEKGNKVNVPFVNDYWVKVMCENGSIGWCYLKSFEEWCG